MTIVNYDTPPSLVSKNAIVGLLGLSSVLSHTDSTENTNVEPTSALLYELFKNTNS